MFKMLDLVYISISLSSEHLHFWFNVCNKAFDKSLQLMMIIKITAHQILFLSASFSDLPFRFFMSKGVGLKYFYTILKICFA
jgi:hypothetical protein